MKDSFRRSMAWLHTWSGLILGWLLFTVFLTGTLSFFRQEITAWMTPESYQSLPAPDAADIVFERLQTIGSGARRWAVDLPTDRDPMAHIYIWRNDGVAPAFTGETLDITTAMPLVGRATYGSDFLYYFHFDLNMPSIWGRLIVGGATIIMLVSIISGVITHRRIFKDFFTFRPGGGASRSWLDAHNVAGVLALPFHLMISYTGLITLMFLYMPWGVDAAYEGDTQAFRAETFIAAQVPDAAGVAVPLVPVTPLIDRASRHWGGKTTGRINVYHPGDANALIELSASDTEHITYRRQKILFSGTTGDILKTTDNTQWAAATRGAMYGLHIGRFADPVLRFLYFFSGLLGTAMIATGLILWAVKRRSKAQKLGQNATGLILVERLNIGTIVGFPIAIAAHFYANRLLPVESASRADKEVLALLIVWVLCLLYPVLRPTRRAWIELLRLAAALYILLPVLNAFTTERHLAISIVQGDWLMIGFDLAFLTMGLCCGFAAYHMQHRSSLKPPVRSLSANQLSTAIGIRNPESTTASTESIVP